MVHLASDQIQIFPTSNRNTAKQADARLTTEYNLINIINRLVDTDSFVVSYKGSKIIFNIHGYLITVSEISNITNSFEDKLDIYAYIDISNTDGKLQGELDGSDNEITVDNNKIWKYSGIKFTDTLSSPPQSQYYLHILERKDNKSPWAVPLDSWIKFKTEGEIRSIYIDDGDLG